MRYQVTFPDSGHATVSFHGTFPIPEAPQSVHGAGICHREALDQIEALASVFLSELFFPRKSQKDSPSHHAESGK